MCEQRVGTDFTTGRGYNDGSGGQESEEGSVEEEDILGSVDYW